MLTFDQAAALARKQSEKPKDLDDQLTVRQALELYRECKESLHQPAAVADVRSRGAAHILPPLGDVRISELMPERLRRWLGALATAPAQSRPKRDRQGNSKPRYRAAPEGDDGRRARRASANRTWTILRAALNHAFHEGKVESDLAWRKVKPFKQVDAARVRYLTVAEAKRLINASDVEFRPLLQAALQTGCRYGELIRLQVHDFNADAGTVAIRKSKTGKVRHVVLTDEGAAFFRGHCAGRAGNELMFQHGDGRGWERSEQARPMIEAVGRARIKPTITFHGLRHTWASLAAMNGVPLMVVARNLGHADTRMVEKHYGHLAPSYVAEAIRAGAPKFGFKPDHKVTTLQVRR